MKTIFKVFLVLLYIYLFIFTLSFVLNMIGAQNLLRLMYKVAIDEFPVEPESELKLIGCSWPRTGTVSTKIGMKRIGYEFYHGSDVFFHGHSHLWMDVIKNPENPEPLDKVVEEILKLGFNATIDFPASLFCLELAERFPNAKVLLNVRDNSEKWFQSIRSIGELLFIYASDSFPLLYYRLTGYSELLLEMLGYAFPMRKRFRKSIFPWVDGKFIDPEESLLYQKEVMKKRYEDRIELVKKTIPKERLLVWNIKEGYDPVSEFLGVESPGGPFPHVNHGVILKMLKIATWIFAYSYPFALVLDFVVLYRIIMSCKRRKLKPTSKRE